MGAVDLRFVPQEGPQTAYIHSPAIITVYGGARGGGKTHGSLGDFWIHAELYGQHAKGLMIRKTREDLKDSISTGVIMYGDAARYSEKGNYFQFRNGARLYCAYLENELDAAHYQGWSLTRVYIEELTQFLSQDPIMRLLATLRSSAGVPCKMKCTCNPGGVGHNWVKAWAIDPGEYKLVTDEDTGISRVFIPARLGDNPKLLEADPGYINKLRAVGSPQLVKAWLEGDWSIVEGAFFPEWAASRHIIRPFHVDGRWLKFRAMDWGSAKPFSVGWYTMVQDTFEHDGRMIPRGALVRYREWYGCKTNQASGGFTPNVGLKMTAEEVARGIVSRETNGKREEINYGIIDPAAYAVISGPSIAETLAAQGVHFRRADNARISVPKKQGGWDQVRNRLKGNEDGEPMLFCFSTCFHLIRTLPVMQHDTNNPEDMDTDGEDHACDELRYACMSRPYFQTMVSADDANQYMVKNAFRLED